MGGVWADTVKFIYMHYIHCLSIVQVPTLHYGFGSTLTPENRSAVLDYSSSPLVSMTCLYQ